ncbi:hypothetical protein FXO38_35020 [Capsicum annuum]|nr:hypothetical protein FXO37_35470 [Capsicum annuum]KAF3615603.1 hypothetical protein FXO38_35020 [Capsicum annuum]
MDPKGDFSKKNTPNKLDPKVTHYSIDEEMTKSSGDLVEYPMKKNYDRREKCPRGKKVATPEDTPLWGPRIKNLSTSPPHSPSSSSSKDDEDNEKNEYESDGGKKERLNQALRRKV